jgi:phosphoglycerate dehydrogenase-like enzyme
MNRKKTAAYLVDDADVAYSPKVQAELAELLDIKPARIKGRLASGHLTELAEVQVILSGWGGPYLDAPFLAALPRLEAVFYAAGTVRGLVTDAFWERDISICSAWGANAVPVAEFTLAQIILCLKHTYQRSRATCAARDHVTGGVPPGNYGSRVGLIGLGMIGRMVAELLQAVLKVEVCAYDPVARPATAAALGVTLVELDALFRECDVVSLHAPSLESTRGMITGQHFGSMKPGASFINTARGAIVREPEMLAVLQARPDLFAVLDVTDPEPPAPDSPLYNLPNVFLTPHIAGSNGRECWRMGEYMLAEVRRFLAGEALFWRVTREAAELMA